MWPIATQLSAPQEFRQRLQQGAVAPAVTAAPTNRPELPIDVRQFFLPLKRPVAPGGYAATPEIQDRLKLLRTYLQRGNDAQHLFNRIAALWASTLVPELLTREQQRATVDAVKRAQLPDGGWTLSSFADWKRQDGSALETGSDGYATGLASFVLQAAGVPRDDAALHRGLGWLNAHQDPGGGFWFTASLNKNRDPQSDAGRFMSDAGTAWAVLALTK